VTFGRCSTPSSSDQGLERRPRVSIEDRPDSPSEETELRAFAGSLREEKGQGSRPCLNP